MQRWACPLFPILAILSACGCHQSLRSGHTGIRAEQRGSLPPAPGPLRLLDVTARSGVRFQHHTGAFGRKWFPETNGAGAAIFDYDADGNPDLFLVNSRSWTPTELKAAHLPAGSPP